MIVCSCNVLSDSNIRSALDPSNGHVCPRTPGAVYKCLGCSPNCGRCFATVRKIINDTLAEHSHAQAHEGGCAAASSRHARPASVVISNVVDLFPAA
ncbi:BFD domain protein (2Fe-2S)-binding domain protein (fragment) [Methylocella tundrae]|uniref:BFD domain protein (2Fe-2S)-binding domain protein n=1 Tax=Methylocella tundrae TaxID=227605 RepID=A0A8B6M1W1_METTU